VNALAAGFAFEIRLLRRSFDEMMVLITAPLMTLIFLSITEHAGRTDLAPYAVLAPALIALWTSALFTSGEIIERERQNGSLEPLVATPVAMGSVITGQILAVTLLSLVGFAESWLAAWAVFGVVVPIVHPLAFLSALLATAFAMAGTASVMSSVFVLSRSVRAYQNSLSYPFFVLGGVMVPVALLPGWIEPLSRVVFLSWSSDLLRDALTEEPVTDLAARLGVILALGTAGFLTGLLLLRRAVDRLRRTGTIGFA
jgi:ABC-2 type transport system permease protein